MTERALRGTAVLLAGVAVLTGCNEQRAGGGAQRDQIAPVVQILKTAGDTLTLTDGIDFAVSAGDNLGLRSVQIDLSGGFTTTIDSVFNRALTTINIPVKIPLASNSTAGGVIVITATATDGANNTATAVDSVILVNPQALQVRIIRPTAGALAAPGRQLPVEIQGIQNRGVRRVGYTVSGQVTDADSIGFGSPLPDTANFLDTLLVPASAPSTGTFTIQGFAVDSAGRRATSSPVTVTLQSITNDTQAPQITLTVGGRVEVDDSVRVRATDPGGVQWIGWIGRDTANVIVRADSVNVGGQITDADVRFGLAFTFATAQLPQTVSIEGFARDAAGNRGSVTDTILVVHGSTRSVPGGGQVADAIFNRNLQEFYLTNVTRDRIEVFQLADTSFAASIPVGSKPWGVALWPRDTLGVNGDTIVVANSGGTGFSIVDVQSRREVRRHHVPNVLVQFVQTEIDQATGTIKLKIEEFDFSDRPQFLGTNCRPTSGGTACHADSVYAVYSTTPTLDQGIEYSRRGTVRWENISTTGAPQSHYFWEQAQVAPSSEFDTLQLIVDRGPGTAPDTILSAACGVVVDRAQIAFAESTFVRNSGNFTHSLVGEGGVVEPALGFGRVIGYDVIDGVTSAACSGTVGSVTFTGRIERDLGISPTLRVRDFIANTAIGVSSIGVNFNGLTNLVRADSVYVLDEGLRLQGIIGAPGPNSGMDLNFDHDLDARNRGTPPAGDPTITARRIVFVATADPRIDVYDTYFYGKVGEIEIRDPVRGPLRVARLASGEQVLLGVTASGVVTVRLPAVSNPFPVRRR